MARVTVEDCVERVPNRFDLVMLAGQRAREISRGGQLTIERDNDKNPVVALREIAESTVDLDHLSETLVTSMQKHLEVDEPDEERAPVEQLEGQNETASAETKAEGEEESSDKGESGGDGEEPDLGIVFEDIEPSETKDD